MKRMHLKNQPLLFLCGLLVALGSALVACSGPESTTPQKKEPPELLKSPLVDKVNPFIGTGGFAFGVGSTFPGASAPFGTVKISPDTGTMIKGNGFTHCAGYAYDDDTIAGFSHIHMHGTGVTDYGNLMMMPTAGPLTETTIKEANYRAAFSKDSEKASPGYYTVTLDKPRRKVELSATTRTAYHRYTYLDDVERIVLLRLDHALPNGTVSDASLTVKSDKEVEGWLLSKGSMSGRHGGFKLYFVLRSKQAFKAGTWKNGKLSTDKTQSSAKIGATLNFGQGKDALEFQVGISFTDLAGARKNLDAEANSAWDLAAVRKAVRDRWEKELSVVRVAGGTKAQQVIFYTAIYHSMLMPTILSDTDGRYRGFDDKIHTAKDFTYYSDFSMWDTYRTLHPLLVLLKPKIQRDMVRSLIQMMKEGGHLPRWPLATGYTSTMVGASADIVIADSYLKGVRDYDIEAAYAGMRSLAMKPTPKGSAYGGRGGIEHYVQKGYVAADKSKGAASVTMEYAYNDFAIAQLAKALGKTQDEALFRKRATNYKNIWDPKTQFFRAKNTDGSWKEGFVDTRWTKDYVEGTAWQYLWFVPHDPIGLSQLFGSKEATFKKLDKFFAESKKESRPGQINPGIRKYYWHGNEPDIHAATLYIELGRPRDGQKWVRWIMDTNYNDGPDGLAGNDDSGTLSAWYVFNALGIYPVPAKDTYLLTSPIFPRAVVTIGGKSFEVKADNAGPKAIYVKGVKLGDKAFQGWTIKHDDLVKDKQVLQFTMSAE